MTYSILVMGMDTMKYPVLPPKTQSDVFYMYIEWEFSNISVVDIIFTER